MPRSCVTLDSMLVRLSQASLFGEAPWRSPSVSVSAACLSANSMARIPSSTTTRSDNHCSRRVPCSQARLRPAEDVTMARRAFLGIDCGTQSTKVLLVDAETLVPLAIGRAHHDLIARDDGTREQHPDWWVSALQAATREAFGGLQPGVIEVAGVGVSGQQHGMVCLDAEDRPVRPAKLWNDTTTEADCAWLTRKLGGLEAVLGLTGNPFLPGYTAPKISWLHRSEPDTYNRTARICLPHDFLNLWLTGQYAAEPGDASGTAYVDVRSRAYQPAVLTLLDDARDWDRTLPPIVPSLSQIGTLRPAAADAL